MKRVIALLVFAAGVCGVAYYGQRQVRATTKTSFNFAEVTRGRLEATVGSTGTLQPRELVDVGAQVLGRIIYIGKDPNTASGIVDWGSEVVGPELDADGKVVKRGTLLAQIDPSLYRAQRDSAAASLKAAEANVGVMAAALDQATRNFGRAERLIGTSGIAQAEYDQFKATYNGAVANLDLAKANVGLAAAALNQAQTNLDYTTISAPVKGVVIDRRVNVGQTVVASLSAPSLFLIAKDLSRMEVWATVNEVDVGKIQAGQDVRFTVDAFPGMVHRGKVVPQGKLPFRLNATMNQNVVTYTVVVSVDNRDGLLRPYMTANLIFVVAEKSDALLLPNSALRWQPTADQIAPELRESYTRLRGKKRSPTDVEALNRGFVWLPGEDGHVRYIEVRTGLSDSVNTEVLGTTPEGALPEHARLITGEVLTGSRGGSSNPFVASPFGKKKAD
jgi:HlyD family secretion protein